VLICFLEIAINKTIPTGLGFVAPGLLPSHVVKYHKEGHRQITAVVMRCISVRGVGEQGFLRSVFNIYSGAKKYLVSHQLCKFSHLKR
jgi:hypothetical protein